MWWIKQNALDVLIWYTLFRLACINHDLTTKLPKGLLVHFVSLCFRFSTHLSHLHTHSEAMEMVEITYNDFFSPPNVFPTGSLDAFLFARPCQTCPPPIVFIVTRLTDWIHVHVCSLVCSLPRSHLSPPHPPRSVHYIPKVHMSNSWFLSQSGRMCHP